MVAPNVPTARFNTGRVTSNDVSLLLDWQVHVHVEISPEPPLRLE